MYTQETLFHDQLRACLNNTALNHSDSTAPDNTGYYAEETSAPQRNSDGSISIFYTVTRCDYPVDNRSRDLALHAQCVLKHNYTTATDTATTPPPAPIATATCTHLRLNLIDLSTQSIVCSIQTPSYGRNKTVTPQELARDIQHAFSRR